MTWFLALRRREKREPGDRLYMRQVPLVTCILLRYTETTTNFSLQAKRADFKAMLLVRHIWKDVKSELNDNSLHPFVQGNRKKDYVICAVAFSWNTQTHELKVKS